MPLFIASLNSGSNGNCYYVGNSNEAVLIDAGISCRETEKRMKRLGLQMQTVKAIFISHEHTDHISGVPVLAKKYNLPVYITATTLRFSGMKIEENLLRSFTPSVPVNVGALVVTAFKKFHDGKDPHSFIVQCNGVSVGVFTDIGKACKEVTHYFKQCHAAFLEANYDETMLMNGSYPVHLKKRISGGEGHLSNTEALQLFIQHRPAFMSHLILSHLSQNNNRPQIVQQLFDPYNHLAEIVVASRYKETSIYRIEAGNNSLPAKQTVLRKQKAVQLSIFGE